MLRLVWLLSCFCLVQVRFTHSACVIYGKEYNAEEYAFLCKDNVTVPEKIAQEILALNSSAAWDPTYFSQLAQKVLDTLMVTFREDVANIYLENTCSNHFCHPHLLKEQKPNIIKNIPRFMEVYSIDLIGSQVLRDEISDLVIVPGLSDEIYLTVVFYDGTLTTLLRYNQNKFDYVSDFEHSGNCIASTSSLWTPPMVIVTSCKRVETLEYEHHQTATTPIYIFTVTNTGMELTQPLELKNSEVTATQVYFNKGVPALLVLTTDGTGHQHIWNDYEFDLLASIPLPTATRVTSFKIGLETYLVFSKFLPFETIGFAGAHVYQSTRQKPDQFRLYQRLGNCVASSTEHFTISDLHFLAITCHEDLAYIYWWAESQFLLLQTIPTVKAKSWTAVRLVNWEILLVLVEYPDGIPVIRFFQYEDDYFWSIDQKLVLHQHTQNSQIKIVSFHHKNDTILVINGQVLGYTDRPIVVPSKQTIVDHPHPHFELHNYNVLNRLSIFKVGLKLRDVKPTDDQDQVELIECLVHLERTLEDEQHRLAMLDVPTWDVMVTDKKQTVSGEKFLLEGLDADVAHVENLILHPTVIVEPADNFICEDCLAIERAVHDKLSRLYNEAEDLVLTTKSEFVTGKKILMNNIVVKESLLSLDIFSGPVCNLNLDDLMATSLHKTGDQFLNVTTVHTHITTTNIDIIGLVNGVDLHNVATLHGSRSFNAPQTFLQVKVDSVEITGKLNEINPREFVVNDLPQTIHGEKKIIGNLIVEGKFNINKLNQIDFGDWARNIMTTDTDQIVTENAMFEELDVKLITTRTLKGRNLYDFSNQVLNTNKTQILNGLITFSSDIIVLNSMNVQQINKIHFPSELLTTNTFQYIRNPIQITGNMTIHGPLTVDLTVNGLDWPYDVVTDHGLQIIAGRKVFRQKKLTVNGRITMAHGSLINAVDVSELGRPSAVLHRNLNVVDLHVNAINGQSIHNLLAVLRTSGRQNITSKFTFTDVELNTIHVRGLIVDHKIEYDFITLNTSQIIDEEVVFDERVKVFSMDFKDGALINGRDLSKIHSNAVHVHGNYVIWGHKVFLEDMTAKVVILRPGVKLANVDISEQLFLTNKQQVVIGRFEINEVEINNNLIIHGDVETKRINKIKVDEFFNKVVYVQGQFLIHGDKNFQNNVVVHHQLNVHLINDFNIDQLQTKIVRLSTMQNITGHLIFQQTLYLNARSYVTKVNRKVLGHEASLLANMRNNKVHTAIKFQDCVKFKKNIEVDTLNNISLQQFFINVLSKSQPQNLSRTRDINFNVKIDHLVVSKLDGILLKDVIKVKDNNTITASIVFHQKLHITSDALLGTINGIKLQELQKQAIIKSESMVIRGRKTFKRVEAREVTVDKFVNNINITGLSKRLVQKQSRQTITGNVIFKKGLAVNQLDSEVPINGVDLLHLKKIAVMTNNDQIIVGRKKFIAPIQHNIEILGNVEVTGSITHVRFMHGLNLTAVKSEALIDGTKQIIVAPIIIRNNVTFNEEVVVIDTINNFRFPHDFVKVNDSQEIRGSVIFASTEILDIQITGFVNHVNLTHLIKNRLSLSTTQTIQRPLIFNEHVTIIGDLIVNQKLNHLTCKEIVSVDGEQDIIGPKTFVNVTTTNIATDFINDIHWLVLHNRIYQTTRKEWIHQEDVSFTGKVILKGPWESDIKAVEGAHVLVHNAKLHTESNIEKTKHFWHWLDASKQCMYDAVPQTQNLVRYLDHLEKAIGFEPALDIAVVPFAGELYLLLVVDPSSPVFQQDCFNVKIYTCPNETNPETCYPRNDSFLALKQALKEYSIQMVQKIDVVYGKTTSFLLIKNSGRNCSDQLGGVHLFGMVGRHLVFIKRFNSINAIAILPGKSDSLLAESGTAGVINVRHIKCVDGKCFMEPSLHQIPYEGKPLKMEWFYYRNYPHLLVITARSLVTGENRVPSFIYEWKNKEMVRKHTFFAVAPVDAVTFTVNNISYFAIGSYDCSNNMDSERVKIHQVSSNKIEIIQEISISTKALSVVQYLDETYLAVAHQENDVFVYRWHGFFGFQLWSKVMINKPQKINWYFRNGVLYMTIAGNGRNSNSLLVTGKTLGPSGVKIQRN